MSRLLKQLLIVCLSTTSARSVFCISPNDPAGTLCCAQYVIQILKLGFSAPKALQIINNRIQIRGGRMTFFPIDFLYGEI